MTFEEWLLSRGLKKSTVNSYATAIRHALSRTAESASLVAANLTEINSASEFRKVAAKLVSLPGFAGRNTRGHFRYSNALDRYCEYLEDEISSDIEWLLKDSDLTETEKLRLVLTRLGQGLFRQRLIQYWGGCCAVTGYNQTSILVASHIQPWKMSTGQQRLNTFNGLLLVPNLDRAFDSGLISFNPNGNIIISPRLHQPDALGITQNLCVKLAPEHFPFMEFHRTTFGLQ